MSKKELTIGKFRGMQQIATTGGFLTMLALDHQESFCEGLNPADPDNVPYAEVVAAKLDIIAALGPHTSALLADLRYAAAQSIAAAALPGRTGLAVTLELSPGYGPGETIARKTAVVPGWNVAKIRRMGAAAVKMLVFYHPHSQTAAYQEEVVSHIAADCREHDIPLVLELLTHPVEPGQTHGSPEFAATRPWVIIESARRLCPLGADVFKAEFPADMKYETDEAKMLDWCGELTEAAGIPWVVLSAGVTHEAFCRQVEISCRGGASGFLAGRSIWKEALSTTGQARQAFLAGEATRRMNELTAISEAHGRPWTDWYQATVSEDWYKQY